MRAVPLRVRLYACIEGANQRATIEQVLGESRQRHVARAAGRDAPPAR
jgi:hypothetical protein